ncbi:MAG: AEC family transporter [Oscillospiraceae bacterium]|nr:AEC family transporter [Oscillospiraceae bacterium]
MIALLLTKRIVILFLYILMGFALVRLRLLKAEDSKPLSVIALYLIMPSVIINAFQIDFTPELASGLLLSLGLAIAVHIVLIGGVAALGRACRLSPVERASVIYSNAGNLVIPIVAAIFGNEWVVYSSTFVCVQQVLLWSHGRALISGQKQFRLVGLLTNVNMIAVGVGLLLFLLRIQLPGMALEVLGSLSAMVAPLCMLVTGMLIGGTVLRRVLLQKRLYFIAALRLVAFPLVILLLMKASGVTAAHPEGDTIVLIALLATITPSASTITQMAQIYDADAQYAGSINVITTLLCIVTMPVMVALYQM